LPTTLELAGGLKNPETIKGIQQDSVQGTSLAYSFNDAGRLRGTWFQHYYIFGSRSIYL